MFYGALTDFRARFGRVRGLVIEGFVGRRIEVQIEASRVLNPSVRASSMQGLF